MSDLISRTEVLSTFADLYGYVYNNRFYRLVQQMPSVEPEKCGDCISRKAVLDYIYTDLGLGDEENGKDLERQTELEDSYRYVKSLPPVTPQPERKPGHWEWDQRAGEYVCSECGCNPIYERATPDVSEIDKYRFCRWCGEKIEVEADHS